MRDLDLLKQYLDLLSVMHDGCEVRFADGKILRRMNGIIWESILVVEEDDKIEYNQPAKDEEEEV